MSKNKNNQTFWSKRVKNNKGSLYQRYGSSIDIDKKLFREDIMTSIAHVEMLFKQKIINFRSKNKIVYGLQKIEKEIEKGKFKFDKKFEDIHMNIEKRLFEIIGDEAGLLHTGRSRNDQVVTDLKIWMRKSIFKIENSLNSLMKSIINLSEKNIYSVMPGFTHLKNAQPISFSHYLLSYIEMFKRDKKKFSNCLESLDENPLGSAAFAGTTFNIDRNFTTKKLGFKQPTSNSLDAVGDRDFVLDYLYTIATCSIHMSRVAEDIIFWNSDALNFIKLKDKSVTGSSIMPQKRNPDPLEYIRGKSAISIGNLISMMAILKGLPSSYFKDLQDDKEIVFKSDELICLCLNILNEVFKNIIINKSTMSEATKKGYILATDIADFFVKSSGLSFREAYTKTANIVNYSEKKNKALQDLSIKEIQKIVPNASEDIFNILNIEKSVESKKSFGGTSFYNIKKMIRKYKKEIK